jgi:hypothetical protein
VTEHYPKALGRTVEEIGISADRGTTVFEKKLFSMVTPEVSSHLNGLAANGEKVSYCVCLVVTLDGYLNIYFVLLV